ncbi:pseudouridine 5'-phosphatase [Aureococcus anophagefferens]|nr:pseudouridine 5'-phosphatase [Aureococcus anophagefferens]
MMPIFGPNCTSEAARLSSPRRWSLRPARGGPRSAASVARPGATAALLFDCDGVLVETEELHRLAYNEAFAAFGLETGGAPVEWSVAYYDVLQNTVGGGKPKMKFHFTETVKEWPAVRGMGGRPTPADEAAGMALVDELQDYKTECYKRLVTSAVPRPGVLELMDDAIATEGLAVGICSASTRGGFEVVAPSSPIAARAARCVIAGDDVANKPDPEIYDLAATRLGVDRGACVVVEDSSSGSSRQARACARQLHSHQASLFGIRIQPPAPTRGRSRLATGAAVRAASRSARSASRGGAMLSRLAMAYADAYARRPLPLAVATGLTVKTGADAFAQLAVEGRPRLDARRTLAMAAFSATVGGGCNYVFVAAQLRAGYGDSWAASAAIMGPRSSRTSSSCPTRLPVMLSAAFAYATVSVINMRLLADLRPRRRGADAVRRARRAARFDCT